MASDERRREGYHHGNLREALIQAALRMIAERGLAGFAIAELARMVGVSPAAPYRHFRDRNAILAEVARRGHARLAAELEAARSKGRPDPVAAFQRCAQAYLDFARRDPAAYAAMFDPGLSDAEDPALQQVSDAAFAVLRRAAEAACEGAPPGGRPPPLMVALHVWSLAHGTASLFVAHGHAARRKPPMSPDDLLEAGLLVYLQSLGLADVAA